MQLQLVMLIPNPQNKSLIAMNIENSYIIKLPHVLRGEHCNVTAALPSL